LEQRVTAKQLLRGVSVRTDEAHRLIVPNPLEDPSWSCESARTGDEVELKVKAEGLPDGTPVQFTIMESDADGQHDRVEAVTANVEGGKATASWAYRAIKDLDDEPTELDKALGFPLPEFFFIACWGGFEAKCEDILKFSDFIHVTVKDDKGEPYRDQEYQLRCGNLVRKGNTGPDGVIECKDVPPGLVAVRFTSGKFLTIE
jgi:hypothetical protein